MELYLFPFHFPVNSRFFSHHKTHNDEQTIWAGAQRKHKLHVWDLFIRKIIKQKIYNPAASKVKPAEGREGWNDAMIYCQRNQLHRIANKLHANAQNNRNVISVMQNIREQRVELTLLESVSS